MRSASEPERRLPATSQHPLLGSRPIQRFIARSYAQIAARKPAAGDAYWTAWATSDASVYLFFGPLTAWFPVFIFAGWTFPGAKIVIPMSMLVLGAVAVLVARSAVRIDRWRDYVPAETSLIAGYSVHTLTKVGIWLLWAGLNPAIWYLALR